METAAIQQQSENDGACHVVDKNSDGFLPWFFSLNIIESPIVGFRGQVCEQGSVCISEL